MVYNIEEKISPIRREEFSNILTTSKRAPLKVESDRGEQFYNSVFRKFLNVNSVHQYSRFTEKSPRIVENVEKNFT